MQREANSMNNQQRDLDKWFDERFKKAITKYLQTSGFMERKLTDTPTDSFQVINRNYSQLNGTLANRPNSSIATIGQFYFATDTGIPMRFSAQGWRSGTGSIVAGL